MKINQYIDFETLKVHTYSLSKRISALVLRPKGGRGYLCVWENSFQFYDIKNRHALGKECVVPEINAENFQCLNDG